MMQSAHSHSIARITTRFRQRLQPALCACLLGGLSLGWLSGCTSDPDVYYGGSVYWGYGYYDPWYWRHYWYRPPYWGPPGYRPPGFIPPRPAHPIAQPRIQNPIARPAPPAARPTVQPYKPTARPAQKPANRTSTRPSQGDFRAGPPRGMRPMGGGGRRRW